MHDRIPKSTPAERRLCREAQSAALREWALALRQAGATFAVIGEELGVSLERARQIVHKAERLINGPRWYDRLPTRAQTFLHNANLAALPEIEAATAVAQYSHRELLIIPNLGRGAVGAIAEWLAGHGLTLRKHASPENKGAPSQKRPHDSDGPLATGRNETTTPCPYRATND
jgi:hypothetical protein